MLRFSLGTLLAVMVLVALGLGALANASEVWSEVMVTMTFVLLVAGLVAASVAHGTARVFATGFTIAGVSYFTLAFVDVVGRRGHLVTNRATIRLLELKQRDKSEDAAMAANGNADPFGGSVQPAEAQITDLFGSPYDDPFGQVLAATNLDIGHALWTLLFALVGGTFAQVVHRVNRKTASTA